MQKQQQLEKATTCYWIHGCMIWSKSAEFKQQENWKIFFSAMTIVYLLNFAWRKPFGKQATPLQWDWSPWRDQTEKMGGCCLQLCLAIIATFSPIVSRWQNCSRMSPGFVADFHIQWKSLPLLSSCMWCCFQKQLATYSVSPFSQYKT